MGRCEFGDHYPVIGRDGCFASFPVKGVFGYLRCHVDSDLMLSPLLLVRYVYWRSCGCVCLQVSCRFNLCLRFLRDLIALRLSWWAGALSMGSLVRLKSPNKKSGFLSLLHVLVFSRSDQKSRWMFLFVGAYTFMRSESSFLCHLIFRASALPSIRVWEEISIGVMRDLFIMKATPREAHRLLGICELRIINLFPKQVFTFSRSLWSRWDSCIANITILCLLIVWNKVDHFSMPVRFCEGVLNLFMLSVAMLMLALRVWFLGMWFSLFPGVGGYGWVLVVGPQIGVMCA